MKRTSEAIPGILLLALAACSGGAAPASFEVLVDKAPAALLSISGASERDVWAVGADRGSGPLVLHHDGERWARVATGSRGDLWWAHALPGGRTVFLAGANATVLRREADGGFRRMATPGVSRHVVYGLWAAGPDDAWAVGSLTGGRGGFVWRLDEGRWREVALPVALRGKDPGLFKVWGDGAGTIWVVGSQGVVLRYDAATEQAAVVETGSDETLFTVHGHGDRVVIVGTRTLLEGGAAGFAPVALGADTLIQGVHVAADGRAVAAGADGQIFLRAPDAGWSRAEHGLPLAVESLHAAWIDPRGGLWAVGGNVLSTALDDGVIVHRGAAAARDGLAAAVAEPEVPPVAAVCPEAHVDPQPAGSIARRWNEQILGAIRLSLPRPGVHARNLYHLSAGMWDAWAAYEPGATSVFAGETAADAGDVEAARAEAISYAAYRILVDRYAKETGGAVSLACFRAFMERLGHDPDDTTALGASPRALGNRVGAAVIAAGAVDGANQAGNYADPEGWRSPNPSLIVDELGTVMTDPSIWQPLNLAVAVTQNGIPTDAGVQGYIGAHWGQVEPFAMRRPSEDALYKDPGPGPVFGDQVAAEAVDVVIATSKLDASIAEHIDISPGAFGGNRLGENDGRGHPVNPATGAPYAPNVVRIGDFGRTLAEFWADGPHSETPPGHWNVIANQVSDHPGFEHRLFGAGDPLPRLEWDVKTYLALNGAVHDAAIAAWEVKRAYLSARPISLVRYMAGLGQRSDPAGPSYHPDGIPLVPGAIEVVTEASSAPGQRHAGLALHVGEVAIMSWRGEPGDRASEAGGCAWMLGVEWFPYQRRTFVTPAFPGYISGHSTFSRAAAEVLAGLTGSPYFPGGLGEFVARADGYLTFERGPSTEVRLQWATYHDAADQAGLSRIWGGIHIATDDLAGRRTGAEVGLEALELARSYF